MSESRQEPRQYPLAGKDAKEEEIRRREKEHFASKDKKRADDQRHTEEQIREKSASDERRVRDANQGDWVKDHLNLNSQISRDEARAARKKSNEELVLGVEEARARRELDRINKPLIDVPEGHLGFSNRPDPFKKKGDIAKTFETPSKQGLGIAPKPPSK